MGVASSWIPLGSLQTPAYLEEEVMKKEGREGMEEKGGEYREGDGRAGREGYGRDRKGRGGKGKGMEGREGREILAPFSMTFPHSCFQCLNSEA